jgi:hypothetical protein
LQYIFKRREIKYIITKEQYTYLRDVFSDYIEPDVYSEYILQNLYFDTPAWDVIRASIEKPRFKEKMRLRCYETPGTETSVFLELKKKYNGIVYKRRAAFPLETLSGQTVREAVADEDSQIAQELKYYLNRYTVNEKVYISHKRLAFNGIEDMELRLTFDMDLRFRLDGLDFSHPGEGKRIIPDSQVIMEIKTPGGMPLWMVRILNENEIFPASFSKYGRCYTGHILNNNSMNGTVKYIA